MSFEYKETEDMDDEWESFFQNNDSSHSEEDNIKSNNYNKNNYDYTQSKYEEERNCVSSYETDNTTPKCSDIYISTKTKISYFNKPIVLNDVFWKIPIMPYNTAKECAIKKQMKFNSSTIEELNYIKEKVSECSSTSLFVEEHIIMQNTADNGRLKFKDVRKISIGLRKKDITSNRSKKKSAFYNCFVVILRICGGLDKGSNNNTFHEINAKVFNTGKIEIPGIQTKEMLDNVLELLTNIIKKIDGYHDLEYIKEKSETVLINSNFRCGYFINREKLYNILKYKYNIKSAYDPCSYPGILCEFYYDMSNDNNKQTGRHNDLTISNTSDKNIKVSFMIFRTGSVLIVGKCEEHILQNIYVFIKNVLEREYINCYTTTEEDKVISTQSQENTNNIDKHRKIKKNIIVYANKPM
jgi:hypothetical protein